MFIPKTHQILIICVPDFNHMHQYKMINKGFLLKVHFEDAVCLSLHTPKVCVGSIDPLRLVPGRLGHRRRFVKVCLGVIDRGAHGRPQRGRAQRGAGSVWGC